MCFSGFTQLAISGQQSAKSMEERTLKQSAEG